MIYLKSYIIDRIKQYKIQLKYIRYQLNNPYRLKDYDKLLAQKRIYMLLMDELQTVLQLLEEV